MPNLWLIRHGESKGNKERLVTGDANDPLTKRGRKQVESLKEYIREMQIPRPTLIVTSSMKRAVETAEIIYEDFPIKNYSELNETDAGEVSCWKRDVFDDRYPNFWASFNPSRPFPGGESHTELFERVVARTISLLKICGQNDNLFLVVHGGTISCIMHYVYDVSMFYFSRFVVDNSSLTMLKFKNTNIPPELVHYNLKPKIKL